MMPLRDELWVLIALLLVFAGLVAWLSIRARARRIAVTHEMNHQAAVLEDEVAGHTRMETELQRAKEAAETANAAKTRYLVAVSHEIRSPLNAIYGFAQLLERGGAISPSEAGGVIRRSAEHLTNLVEGLLEISRIESGVLKVRTDIVQLPILLDHVVDMFRMQAEAKGIELRYAVDGRLPRFVRTDERRLRQILINLMSNAIKYTSEGSATLAITYRSQVAQVDISDTGIGIAPEDLERIFEPFERGSAPEVVLQPGVGLGLAITRVLARILGGEIAVTSMPGVGSRFRLSMFLPEPFTPPDDDPADYSRIIGYDGPRRTVMVVDDHQSQTTVLESLLRQLGFVVYVASNGADGLALADKCQPDLVLLDVQMPGISGWDVAAQLRARYGGAIRIVMVSATAHEVQGGAGRTSVEATGPGHSGENGEANHDAYVSKPVDLEALLAVIGRELKLRWDIAGDRPARTTAGPARPLPDAAAELVGQIRQLARVGHIRAVEAALGKLEASVPGSAPAVAAMRDHVRNFDLRSLMTMLDDDQSR